MTTIYIDSLFALNLIINYLLLLLTSRLSGLPFKRWRLFAGAALGALYAVLVVLPGLQWLSAIWIKCAMTIPITILALGIRRSFWRGIIMFWISSFLLAGIVLCLGLLFGGSTLKSGVPYVPVSLRTLLLTAAAAYFLLTTALKGFARYGGTRSRIVTVQVSYLGQSSSFDALVDTGHALSDPMTGQQVIVVDLPCVMPLLPKTVRGLVTAETLSDPISLLERMQPLDSSLRLRLIPYQTIGKTKGWLLAFRPDSVTISGQKRGSLLIGMSPTALSEGRPYAALVGV